MVIKQSTLDALQEQGITLRWYPELTFEEHRQKVWEHDYSWHYNYGKNGSFWDGEKKEFRKHTHEELDAGAKKWADDHDISKSSRWLSEDKYESSRLYIDFDGHTATRKIAGKSEDVKIEKVLYWVERERKLYAGEYGDFATKMQTLLREANNNSGLIYPTTYGVGIFIMYNWHRDKMIKWVEELLSSKGIEYTTEYSDAQWVFRYRVSKKNNNLNKL